MRGLPESWQIKLTHASVSWSQWLAQTTYITLCDFIHQGDPHLQQNTASSRLWLLQKRKCTQLAPRRIQGVPGKQKPRNPLLVSSGWIGGFRELSLLGRAPSCFPWVSYTAAVQHVSVSPSSRVTQPLRAVLSVSDYKLQYSSFCSVAEISLIVTVAKLLITPRVPGSKPEPTFSGSAFTSRQRRNLPALAL